MALHAAACKHTELMRRCATEQAWGHVYICACALPLFTCKGLQGMAKARKTFCTFAPRALATAIDVLPCFATHIPENTFGKEVPHRLPNSASTTPALLAYMIRTAGPDSKRRANKYRKETHEKAMLRNIVNPGTEATRCTSAQRTIPRRLAARSLAGCAPACIRW